MNLRESCWRELIGQFRAGPIGRHEMLMIWRLPLEQARNSFGEESQTFLVANDFDLLIFGRPIGEHIQTHVKTAA